jgi:hypothetical protein
LRPTLPTILTGLVVILIEIWGGSIILERFLTGRVWAILYFEAILVMDTAVIVGLTVVYAYFLALTIFVLDIAYAFIDPRMCAWAAINRTAAEKTASYPGLATLSGPCAAKTVPIAKAGAPTRSVRRGRSLTALQQLLHGWSWD